MLDTLKQLNQDDAVLIGCGVILIFVGLFGGMP